MSTVCSEVVSLHYWMLARLSLSCVLCRWCANMHFDCGSNFLALVMGDGCSHNFSDLRTWICLIWSFLLNLLKDLDFIFACILVCGTLLRDNSVWISQKIFFVVGVLWVVASISICTAPGAFDPMLFILGTEAYCSLCVLLIDAFFWCAVWDPCLLSFGVPLEFDSVKQIWICQPRKARSTRDLFLNVVLK